MTAIPPPHTPEYAAPYTEMPGRRPTSVTVLAIIGLVLASLFLLCMPISLVFMFIDLGVPNPAMDALKSDPFLRAYSIVGTVFMILLMLGVAFCCIGCFYLKPWARSVLVLLSWVTVAYVIAGQVVNFLWYMPKMEAALRNAGAPSNAMWASGPIGAAIGVVLNLAYPVCVLYFFTRPQVRAAFDASETTTV